ncbi:MAG: hypothetical protein KKE73_13510 [Proteobacteria bacterium]|nr:hypothetical protein [Pseudomonadota bacterium]
MLLIIAIVFGGIVRNVRANYLSKIRSLRRQAFDLDNEVKDFKADVLIREAKISNLVKQIQDLELIREQERAVAAAAAENAPRRTLVQALQCMGRVTAEDVLRARTYLENAKSGSTVEEALLILGIVTSEDMQDASREVM